MDVFERGERPRRGHPFWDGSREPTSRTGEIISVIRNDDEWDVWEDGEVVVKFPDGNIQSYIFEEIDGCWTDKFGGTWMINE